MAIIVQKPEILVYHCVGTIFDHPRPFGIAGYKGTTARLELQ